MTIDARYGVPVSRSCLCLGAGSYSIAMSSDERVYFYIFKKCYYLMENAV